MQIRDFYWRRYKIPFRRTFANRYEELAAREGALLFMESDSGARGLGEVAPLAGFGGGLEAALALLARVRPQLIGTPITESGYWQLSAAVSGWGGADDSARVVLSGLCLAFFDLMAQERGLSLAAYLANGAPVAARVPVNATLGGVTEEALRWEAEQAAALGFRCVKMKVGRGEPEVDIGRVRAVRESVGAGVELRVDANGAWTFDEAVTRLARLAEEGVALVEQPLAPHHRAGLRMLRERFPMLLIAADESIVDLNSANAVLATDAADVLVVKPMVVGGPVDGAMIGRNARERGKGVIVTSLLESGVGVAGALQVAAAVPPPILHCGLATAELLEVTLIQESLRAEEGYLTVPQGVGLGVTLDETAIAAYCGEEQQA